jgi:hypothetical protein
MKLIWTLIALTCTGSLLVAAEPAVQSAPDKKPVPIPPGLDIVNRLRDALKSGTPAEKEAALNMIRDLKPITLIPDLIEAIEDATELPNHVSGECKTGWGFVGHQAATVLGEIARGIDGVEVGMKPGQRAYQSYSFHNDLEQGAKMKKSGRLSEVRKNWSKWWDAHQQK